MPECPNYVLGWFSRGSGVQNMAGKFSGTWKWIPAKYTLAPQFSRLMNRMRAGMLREGRRGNDEQI